MSEREFKHRGQWEGQDLPNSFETARLYGQGIETDVMLLGDNKTLGIAHPADFETTDQAIESMSPEEFGKLKAHKGERLGGAAPFFKEYLALCYDRGIPALLEVKAGSVERSVATARRLVETIKEMRDAGAFEVQGKEHPELIEQMGIHSWSAEAIREARQAMEETGVRLKLGFTLPSSLEYAKSNPLAQDVLNYYRAEEVWETTGLRAAQDLGCNYVFFMEPERMTKELVDQAHQMDLELYMYIRPKDNTPELRDKLFALGVDKLLY